MERDADVITQEETGEENFPNATETGWASMLTFPRIITVDPSNSTRVCFFPIDEIKSLWLPNPMNRSMLLEPGRTRGGRHPRHNLAEYR